MTTSIKFSDIKHRPPLTPERIAEIKAFENTDFSDCPEMTDEDWKRARPAYTKIPQVDVHVRLDADVLGWLKGSGKGCQTRINAALRYAMQNGF